MIKKERVFFVLCTLCVLVVVSGERLVATDLDEIARDPYAYSNSLNEDEKRAIRETQQISDRASYLEETLMESDIDYAGLYINNKEIIVQTVNDSNKEEILSLLDSSGVTIHSAEYTLDELEDVREELELLMQSERNPGIHGLGVNIKENKVTVWVSEFEVVDILTEHGVDSNMLDVSKFIAFEDQANLGQ